MSSGTIKEIKALVKEATKAGCTQERLRNSHIKLTAPNGAWMQLSFSPARDSGVRLTRRRVRKFIEENCKEEQ